MLVRELPLMTIADQTTLWDAKTMRVVVADDNELSLRRVCSMAANWGFEAVPFKDGSAAWEAMHGDESLRLAILDCQMPGLSGVDICRRARLDTNGIYRFLILLTGSIGKESLVEGLQAGADDFIRKPFDAAELELRLRSGTRIIQLQDRLLKAQQELKHQADTDCLTGLMNRGAILAAMESSFRESRAGSKSCGVLLLDIDYFKSVNDMNGHAVGDDALRHVAEVVRSAIGPRDLLGRFGGEEFLVLSPHASLASAEALGNAILQAIRSTPLKTSNGELALSASAGLSMLGEQTDSILQSIKQSDDALYAAKRAGRDRLCACPEPHSRAVRPYPAPQLVGTVNPVTRAEQSCL